MFCRNCGKSIPDDSKFCPYCGTNCNLDDAVTTTVSNSGSNKQGVDKNTSINFVVNNKVNRQESLKERILKFSPQKIKKIVSFSTFFKISTILCFVGVLVYFAGSPILMAIRDKSVFKNIYIWFMLIYTFMLIGITTTCIILLVKNKKELELTNIKLPIIAKSICIAILIGLAVMLIIYMINGYGTSEHTIEIPTMILTGFAFVTSGLNGSMSQPYVILTNKTIKQLKQEKK